MLRQKTKILLIIRIFLRSCLQIMVYVNMISGKRSKLQYNFYFFVIVFDMMKLLGNKKTAKTMVKESEKICSENKISIFKSFFYIQSHMSIINSITYKIYKFIKNQASIKVKHPSFMR